MQVCSKEKQRQSNHLGDNCYNLRKVIKVVWKKQEKKEVSERYPEGGTSGFVEKQSIKVKGTGPGSNYSIYQLFNFLYPLLTHPETEMIKSGLQISKVYFEN